MDDPNVTIPRDLLDRLIRAAEHPEYPAGDPDCVQEARIVRDRCPSCEGTGKGIRRARVEGSGEPLTFAGPERCVACGGSGVRARTRRRDGTD